jgi:hypothetical protein
MPASRYGGIVKAAVERGLETDLGESVKKNKKPRKPVSLGRHEANCTICAHEKRWEIERDFVAWKSPTTIAVEYGLPDRASIYRHVQAFNMGAKRARNIRAALERIIEKVGDVDVTAAAVVARDSSLRED